MVRLKGAKATGAHDVEASGGGVWWVAEGPEGGHVLADAAERSGWEEPGARRGHRQHLATWRLQGGLSGATAEAGIGPGATPAGMTGPWWGVSRGTERWGGVDFAPTRPRISRALVTGSQHLTRHRDYCVAATFFAHFLAPFVSWRVGSFFPIQGKKISVLISHLTRFSLF